MVIGTIAPILLMNRREQPATRYIYRFLGDQTDALDLAQQTFIRIFEQKHRFREERKFSTWMFAIATDLCRNFLRWRSRHR
jgi:RNA polymerase sigma-70 factor (ECF subfamily)